ncbi:MAG: hypothetical protein ACXW0M_00815, partial [Methylosarcina sp.]
HRHFIMDLNRRNDFFGRTDSQIIGFIFRLHQRHSTGGWIILKFDILTVFNNDGLFLPNKNSRLLWIFVKLVIAFLGLTAQQGENS